MSDSLKGMEPGILNRMIEMLNIDDIDQTNTFKLCFEGKKINAGVDGQLKGDVNIFCEADLRLWFCICRLLVFS